MKIIYFILVLLVVFSGLWLLNRDTVSVLDTHSPVVNDQNSMRDAPLLVEKTAKQTLSMDELEKPFAPDAMGTEVDGRLKTDEFGDLIVDTELKSFFDYFLSSVGQVTPEQAIHRIQLHIAHQLEEPAAGQAIATLKNYLAFKEASIDLLGQPIDTQKVETDKHYQYQQLSYALTELKRLRREFMGDADASAFFKEEEAYGDYTLSNQSIALNDALTPQEKAQQRKIAQSQLPEDMREHVIQQEQQARRSQALTELLANKPSVDELSNFVYENYSSEQAANLVSHYKRELEFRNQYEQYRQRIETTSFAGLTDQQIRQEKHSIAQQFFDESQLSMVQALDQGIAQTQ